MPKLNMSVKHKLSQREARKRVERLLGNLKKEHGDKITDLHEKWSENSCRFGFKAMGFSVSGSLMIEEKSVKLQGDLPFAAVLFKGRIEDTIRSQAEKLLA